MRIVENAGDFPELLLSCQREAASSFGNDQILIEKYLLKPRHVEIQVFADSKGNCVHLFERDCSVQRRHQKVIEEAPAPSIPADIREKLGTVAIQSAKAIGYVGAGTVEFLYSANDEFYFMEMNTRLQVEHPVTEMITSQDLVEWQLRVASGEPLPLTQDQIVQNGHAFEVRIYAEDPNQDFLPAIGIIKHLQFPQAGPHVRIDSGVIEGDDIGIHYDPMIAKLIVWDADRNKALARLEAALEQCQIAGLKTNLSFLLAITTNPSFKNLKLDTGFIEREHKLLFPATEAIDNESLAMLAMFLILQKEQQSQANAKLSIDPYSPWNQVNGWRLNKDNYHPFSFEQLLANNQKNKATEILQHDLLVHFKNGQCSIEFLQLDNDHKMMITAEITQQGNVDAVIDGHRVSARIIEIDDELIIFSNGKSFNLSLLNNVLDEELAVTDGNLTAPMPGSIISIEVDAGNKVSAGDKLMVLEAMKMEHAIIAPADGLVEEIFYRVGDQVQEGSQLLQFAAES
jgi:3-methylcrotonyl-CoA carboxylase alpha subunit